MRPTAAIPLVLLSLLAIGAQAYSSEHAKISPEVSKFLETYCHRCHGSEKQKGSQRFDTMPTEIGDAAIAQRWQDVLDTLNLDEMPPEDAKQPPKEEFANALETLTTDLAHARKRLTDAGGDIVIRRLNRREYEETIRHLFGVPIEVDVLPDDAKIDGFDTLGQAQSFSSLHLERYLDLGRRALDRVILTDRRFDKPFQRRTEPEDQTKKIAEKMGNIEKNIANFEKRFAEDKGKKESLLRLGISQAERKILTEYLDRPETKTGTLIPFHGINPSTEVKFNDNAAFGTYKFRVRCGADAARPQDDLFLKVVRGEFLSNQPDSIDCYQVTGTIADPREIEFTVELDDRIRSNRFSLERRNGRAETLPDLAESRNYYFQFPQVAQLRDDTRPDLWIDWVDVEGPLPQNDHPLDVATLFPDRDPGKFKELPKLEDAELRVLLERFTYEAFRHQKADSEYLDLITKVYTAAVAHGTSSADALKDTLAVVLASPRFLFLYEPRPESTPPRALADRELAVRLSYFLWSAPPDDELYQIAESGKLRDSEVLAAQVDRMIASERTSQFIETFLTGWLELDRLGRIKPEATTSPYYDDAAQLSSRKEVAAFFNILLNEDLPVHNLIDSEFVVIDSILARFYKIPGVSGDGFRKVALPSGSVRGGLLGQSAILTLTGTGDRTSPVERGAFVLRKLLHHPPAPAPANVPMLDEETIGERSIRETLDIHMNTAQCQSCHQRIDPLGFGMENFDPVGLWREEVLSADLTTKFPIEPAGTMPDGKRTFSDFKGMKRAMLDDRDALLEGITESLLTYALGRTIGFTDAEMVDRIIAETATEGYGLKSLIHKIVQSEPFLTK